MGGLHMQQINEEKNDEDDGDGDESEKRAN